MIAQRAPSSRNIDELVYGAPALREAVASTEMKAVTLESRKRAVTERFGAEGVAKVAAALSGEALRLWTAERIFTSSWLPTAPYLDIERAILRELLDDDVERMVGLVTEIAESELNLLYRFILKLGNPGFVLKRMGVTFETKVRPGRMVLVEAGERSGVLDMHDVVLPELTCAYTAPAWAARAMEMTGARNVETVHARCRHRGDPCCRYESRWD